MTDENKPKRKPAPPIVEADFISPSGIPRRVLVPQGETNLAAGIPSSLDLSRAFPHMPDSFVRELTISCHAVGLVKPIDFFAPDAGQRFRAAMLSVIRHDFSNVQAIAKEDMEGKS